MPKVIDLTGQQFHHLTAIKQVGFNKQRQAIWECRCDCGNITIVRSSQLRNNRTKSCGCLRKKRKNRLTHGMSKTPEFKSWAHMIDRCHNPNAKPYKNYGGRGIKVCDEWRNDFIAFFNHIGKKPSPKHSIDRINNNGDYEPNNVRWATYYEQSNNRRYNHKITLHNITMNMSQWAAFTGIDSRTIYDRLKDGWPPAKAIFQPVRKSK